MKDVMKKSFYIFIFSIIILAHLTSSQSSGGLDTESLQNDSIVEGVKTIQEIAEEKKWEYTSEQWKETLLKSKAISALDNYFKKINLVFLILFGQDYSLSLTLFAVILLWVFFLAIFEKTIKRFSTFSVSVSGIIALILTIIFAQFKIYNFLASIILKILFFKEGVWRIVSIVIFALIWLMLLIFSERLIWSIGRRFQKTREEKEKWDEKFQRQLFRKKVASIEKSFTTLEDSLND